MPVFAFRKQGFDPDAPFAHGFLVRQRRMVGADPLEVLLIEAASKGSSLLTCGAVLFERTGITGGRIGSILVPGQSC